MRPARRAARSTRLVSLLAFAALRALPPAGASAFVGHAGS